MKKKFIISAIVIIFVGIIVISRLTLTKTTTDKVDKTIWLNSTDVTHVYHGNVNSTIAFTGDLTPLNQTIIASEIDAEVLQVNVAEGQFVTKNQVLAKLDDTNLKEQVRAEEALLSAKRAAFALNQQKLERQKSLYQQGFISKFAYEELKTNYQSSLDAINQEEAQYKQAQRQLSYTTVRAPFAGFIYQKNIDPGQLASKNSKLFAIASLDQLQIKAPIASDQINQISLGQLVTFKVEDSNQEYGGKVTRINPVAVSGTRSYLVYINFDNTKAKLKAGQFVKGQIILQTMTNVNYLSNDAINHDENGKNFVLVLDHNVTKKLPITILLSNWQNNISAVAGVESGDVTINANIIPKPGAYVRILAN